MRVEPHDHGVRAMSATTGSVASATEHRLRTVRHLSPAQNLFVAGRHQLKARPCGGELGAPVRRQRRLGFAQRERATAPVHPASDEDSAAEPIIALSL